jgi:hypothetical protein
LNPSSGIAGTLFTISGDYLAITTTYGLFWEWDSSRSFISTARTDGVGHLEGIAYTAPLTATSGLYTVTARLDGAVAASALFEVP